MALDFFDVTRNTTKTVLNAQGVLETVPANVPAFEFNADGSYKGCLIEPSATNLLLRSEEFDNAYWTKAGLGAGIAPIVTANDAIAPNGTTTADRIDFDAGGNTVSDRSLLTRETTTTSGQTVTISFFAKAATSSDIGKNLVISLGVVSFGLITLTNNYVRYTFTTTLTISNAIFRIETQGNQTQQQASIHLWGAQLEEGSVATSYIPTVASTATRNADVISKTGASGLIGQTEGTIYAECDLRSAGGPSASGILTLTDTTAQDGNNRIIFSKGAFNKKISFQIRQNNTLLFTFNSANDFVDGINRIAFLYSAGLCAFYLNGVKIGENALTPSFTNILNVVKVGYYTAFSGNQPLNDHIRSFALYKRALTQQEAEVLTS